MNLSLSVTGTGAATGHVESCPDINGPGCAASPGAGRDLQEWHDLKLFFGELRLHADYGITDWLTADLNWSLRVVSVKFVLRDSEMGPPITPPFGGVDLHHRSETLVGFTDPWLSLRATQRLGEWSFRFRAGATIPLGSSVPNPFALGRQGKEHEHIQFGSGTVDPLVEVGAQRTLGNFSIEGWMLAKASLYRNRFGYQAGNQLMGGVRASSDLWRPRWRFMLGVLAYHEEAERWDGAIEQEGNRGRTDLIAETSILWRFSGAWAVAVAVHVPLASWVIGEQLSTPAIAELSFSRPFDLLGGGK